MFQKLDKSLHVVVVDLLGHGNSSLPSDDKEISVFRLADELHEVTLADNLFTTFLSFLFNEFIKTQWNGVFKSLEYLLFEKVS